MAKKQVTIPIFVPHNGCPHQCAFCNQFSVSGQRKTPNRTSILSEIKKYQQTIAKSVKHIEVAFFGGSFTGIDKNLQIELLDSVQDYYKSGFINGIRLSTRPDYIESEKLDLLKKYNVTTIELGVQSLNNNVLQSAERGHTVEDVVNAVKLIKSYGFKLIIQLMPGLPNDNLENSISDAQFTVNLNPDGVRLYPTVVLKNTKLAELYNKKLFRPLTLEEAIQRVVEMKIIFDQNQIPIIRMGLHPISKNEIDTLIAGPYHTAFGFLVKARLKRNLIEKKINTFLNGVENVKSIHIQIPLKYAEEYIGIKKQNIIELKKIFKKINITYAIIKTDKLVINEGNKCNMIV